MAPFYPSRPDFRTPSGGPLLAHFRRRPSQEALLKPNTFGLGGSKSACGASGGNILPLRPCFPSRAPGRHHSQLQNNHIREVEHDDTDFGRFGDLLFGPPPPLGRDASFFGPGFSGLDPIPRPPLGLIWRPEPAQEGLEGLP